jgi:hypothetical protein
MIRINNSGNASESSSRHLDFSTAVDPNTRYIGNTLRMVEIPAFSEKTGGGYIRTFFGNTLETLY